MSFTMNPASSNSPSSQATVAAAAAPKKNLFQGPCYLKMLVSNLVAGSIIGKSGAVIGNIESSTGASMKLSPSNQFFPGTGDRIVVMSGEQEQINRAMFIILEKVGEVTAAQFVPDVAQGQLPKYELNTKIVVPKSAVSGIIGKAGQQIKQLQEQSGAKIQISNREQGLNERVVSINGSLECLQAAALQISTAIQEDQNLKDNMYVMYSPSSAMHGALGGGMHGGHAGSMGFAGYGQYMGPTAASAGGYPYSAAPFPGAGGVPPATQPSASELEHLMMEQCEISMEIPDICMGAVIGKGGVHLTDIMRTTGASIKLSQKGDLIPGTQNRKVTIGGSLSSVHRAHARLVHRLKETQQQHPGSIAAMTRSPPLGALSAAYGLSNPSGPGGTGIGQAAVNHHNQVSAGAQAASYGAYGLAGQYQMSQQAYGPY